MKKIEFQCEVLSPLFLGGAETPDSAEERATPELRAPSIRGALRYWYRAVLGGAMPSVTSTNGHTELAAQEGRLFGAVEHGSPIAVRVSTKTPPGVESYRKERATRTSAGGYIPSGKDYLFWSMAESGQPGTSRFRGSRKYIVPGTRFAVTLQTLHNDNSLEKATAAFWLLTNLGALGSRANRGAGSVAASVSATESANLLFKACGSIAALQSHLSVGIRKSLSQIGGDAVEWNKTGGTLTPYNVLSPDGAEIWVVSAQPNGWDSDTAALTGIGEKFRDYRSHQNPLGKKDHDTVLKWMEQGGGAPEIARAAFGLPIPFRYSGGGPSDVIVSESGDRRASPLRIKLARLSTGKYVGVLVLFKSRFLEEGKQLKLQTRKWQAPQPKDYQVIQNFIQTFEVKQRVAL